ncbi:MAG: ABC transporter substrate-binding protein [Eubacteriales bacterium]|nr:ABC transporter substrate-binding protein [uncultured Blautia sp.]MDO5799241.1 ABC transporter substrate-binding protein [Eubacteriales bacterium]
MKNWKKVLSLTAAVAMTATMMPVSVFAAEDETFKIGVIGPMTGDYAQYGLGVYHAAQVAAEEINANGGFNGYNVEILDAGDDQGDPEKAVNAYNDLLDKGMQMLCGTVTSGACIAVGAEAAESTFLFTPSGTALDCITAGSNEFRMCFTDPAQGTKSAEFIGEHKLATKVAVLYDSMADYNSGVHDAFVAAAEENGLEVVADEAYTTDNNTDYSVQLKKIKDSGAELLFLPNYYSDNALILQQAHDAGMDDIKKFGVDGMDGILGVENFDTSLAEGVMLLTPFSATSEDEKSKAFVEAYEAANKNEVPNQFAADAYDVLFAMQLAANDAAITPDMSNEDISAAMSASMLNIELDGLTGKAKWSEDGECDKEPKAFEIKDGAYVEMN